MSTFLSVNSEYHLHVQPKFLVKFKTNLMFTEKTFSSKILYDISSCIKFLDSEYRKECVDFIVMYFFLISIT